MSDSSVTPKFETGPEGSEAQLVSALRAGDEAAYERLVETYGGRLLAVTRRMLHNEEDAQDALQEAFLSAFKAIGQFDEKSKLGTWLHRIAINAALMKLRTRRRKPEQSIDELLPRFLTDGHQADPPSDWGQAADRAMERAEMREFVRQSIDRLPEAYRTVLLLRDIEELDTAETARLLEVTDAIVKTRLHRARQALRTLLDPYFRGGGP